MGAGGRAGVYTVVRYTASGRAAAAAPDDRGRSWPLLTAMSTALGSQQAPPESLNAHPFTPTQLDEVDMGMTYAELTLYGRLRKVRQQLSPVRRAVGGDRQYSCTAAVLTGTVLLLGSVASGERGLGACRRAHRQRTARRPRRQSADWNYRTVGCWFDGTRRLPPGAASTAFPVNMVLHVLCMSCTCCVRVVCMLLCVQVARAGPVAMYNACAALWRGRLAPQAIAAKVRAGTRRGGGDVHTRPS